jgi:hypothetical protein
MEPICLGTTLDVRDWRALQAYIGSRLRRTPLGWRQVLIALSGLIVTVVAVAVTQYFFSGRAHGTSIGLGVIIGIGALAVVGRFQGNMWLPKPGSSWFTPTWFHFDASGVRASKDGQEGFVAWRSIEHIEATDDHLFLSLTEFSAYVIPKRAMTTAPPAEVIAQIQGWYAQRQAVQPSSAEALAAPSASAAPTGVAIAAAAAESPPGFWRALRTNLYTGLRALLLRRVPRQDIVPTFDQIVALLVIALATWTLVDWINAGPGAIFRSWGLSDLLAWLMLSFWVTAAMARAHSRVADTRSLMTVVLAAVPTAILIVWALAYVPFIADSETTRAWVTVAATVLIGMGSLRAAFGRITWRTTAAFALSVLAMGVINGQLYMDATLWQDPPSEEEVASPAWDRDAAESLLFDEKARVSSAVEQLAPERPGVSDVFYVGFGGDGSQRVFRREALFGKRVFGERMGSGDRSLVLINDEDDTATYPLATLSGLRHALFDVGARMDTEEDILVLLLTSHGGKTSGIQVDNGMLPLNNIDPASLRDALDAAGIKWRVVIVSACYAGTFIEPLENDTTLIVTAADAEHTSFGCADERDLTYFGEAFLRDALPKAPSLESAFETARKAIAQRENTENLTSSNPQISVGAAIRKKLATLGNLPIGVRAPN